MNQLDLAQLEVELREVGATSAEAAQLAELGDHLHGVGLKERPAQSRAIKLAMARQIVVTAPAPRRVALWMKFAGSAAAALVIGVTLASVVRDSSPGQIGYPLKRAAEQITLAVQPSYRDQMMMHRSEEVNHLVAVHAPERLIAATMRDYTNDVNQTTPQGYHALEYCTQLLKDARMNATGTAAASIDAGLRAASLREQNLRSMDKTL